MCWKFGFWCLCGWVSKSELRWPRALSGADHVINNKIFPAAAQSTPGLNPGFIWFYFFFFSPGFQCVMGSYRAARIYHVNNVNNATVPLFKEVIFFSLCDICKICKLLPKALYLCSRIFHSTFLSSLMQLIFLCCEIRSDLGNEFQESLPWLQRWFGLMKEEMGFVQTKNKEWPVSMLRVSRKISMCAGCTQDLRGLQRNRNFNIIPANIVYLCKSG